MNHTDDELKSPFQDTAAYRIGTEVHRHSTKLEIMEHDRLQLAGEIVAIKTSLKELMEHLKNHEHEDHYSQRRMLGFIILTLLSATGGLIVLTVQSLVTALVQFGF